MPLDIINNATSSLTGGVQSAFSSASSLADKVNFNNIKDIANQGIDKISNAAKGLIAKPTAQIETKIPTNALPKIGASTKDTAPLPPKPKLPPSTLTYPVDMKYYTTFKFLKYRRILATDQPTEAYTAVIVLPMPSNLNESHSLDYETANLGALIGAGTELATSLARTLQNAPGARDREEASAKGLLAGAAVAVGTSMFGKKQALAAAARRTTGLTPNPYQAVVFQNVNLRSHSFTYRFAPNSFEELQTVKKIIKQFKKCMLPSFLAGSADMAFAFPDECEISFGPNKDIPYKFKKSVLENMTVNYSPNGPAFFKTGDPVIVEISLSFKEVEPYTKRDEGERDTVDEAFEKEKSVTNYLSQFDRQDSDLNRNIDLRQAAVENAQKDGKKLGQLSDNPAP